MTMFLWPFGTGCNLKEEHMFLAQERTLFLQNDRSRFVDFNLKHLYVLATSVNSGSDLLFDEVTKI